MSETARMLDDSADRLFRAQLDDSTPRTDTARQSAILAELIEAGLPLTLRPEDEGGLGASLTDAAVVARRAGWHAAPLPVAELLLTGLLPEPDRWSDGDTAIGFAVSGRTVAAHAMPETKAVIAVAPGKDGGAALWQYDPAAAEVLTALPGTPLLRFAADAARSELACPDAARIARAGALLSRAAMAGAMERVVEIVIEHANTRKQFGRPLGKFQAIQHMLAEAASERTVADGVLTAALAAESAGEPDRLLLQSAIVQFGRAGTRVAEVAHQVMGAMGFTEEHVLHNYTKRLWVWRDDWMRQSAAEEGVGRDACADPRGLWSHIIDGAADGARSTG